MRHISLDITHSYTPDVVLDVVQVYSSLRVRDPRDIDTDCPWMCEQVLARLDTEMSMLVQLHHWPGNGRVKDDPFLRSCEFWNK